MPDTEPFLKEIDAARVRRVKELSEINRRFSDAAMPDPSNVGSKAVVVLTYASWEGFYNECVRSYVRFLSELGGMIRKTDWMLLCAAFTPDFESLRSRQHSTISRIDFVKKLKHRLNCEYSDLDRNMIESRSNLDFSKLSQNYLLLSFDLTPLQSFRIRLDKELVGWRHSVAHGDQPDLQSLDIAEHIKFASQMLLLIADEFQKGILHRATP